MPGFWGDAERWLDEARVAEAADARSRRHWLRRQLDAEATIRGVLLDLLERGDPVRISTAAGIDHAGELAAVEADHLRMRLMPEGELLVPLGTLVSIRTEPCGPAGAGRPRLPATGLVFSDALGDLAAAGASVTLRTATDTLSGTLAAVGQDMVTVHRAGPPAATVYVSLDFVLEVSVLGSG